MSKAKKNVGVNVGVKLSARERDLIEILRHGSDKTWGWVVKESLVASR